MFFLPPQEAGWMASAEATFGFIGAVAGVMLVPALLAHAMWLRKYYPDRSEIVLKTEWETWKESHRKELGEILEKVAKEIRDDMQAMGLRIGGQELANQQTTTAMLVEIKSDVRQALDLSRDAREQAVLNERDLAHQKEISSLRFERCESELKIREKRVS